MLRKAYVFIYALLFNISCQAYELPSDKAIVLEEFFQVILQEDAGGYVLYGKKPICIIGFDIHDYFLGTHKRHRDNIILREGAKEWKKTNLNQYNENLILHIFNNSDSLVKNNIHILFINKNLFLQTVRENLPIFQYVLGPEITPEKLLERLTDPDESFHSVLKENKVLIGIVLGFGLQNSLYVSRLESIESSFYSAESLPFKRQVSHEEINENDLYMLLTSDIKTYNQKNQIQPSFGYQSLNAERKSLDSKCEISSLKLETKAPRYIFGRIKNDEESNKLVSELEDCQDKICELLASTSFLKKVLQTMFPKEEITIPLNFLQSKQQFFEASETAQLPFLVASNIWKNIENENKRYLQFYLEGMKDSQKSVEAQYNGMNSFKYEKIKALLKMKNNLKDTDDFFAKLDQDPLHVKVSHKKLYYKTLQQGTGEVLDNQTDVVLHYAIKTPDNQCLADTYTGGIPTHLNLAETIPGFAWGIKGMKVGEMREVYIHPSLGYGIYTTLDKGIYLKANIQLVEIVKNQEINKFPELTMLDLTTYITPSLDSDFLKEEEKVAYLYGYHVWQHYKKCDLYTLQQIIDWIIKFQSGENSDISSKKSQDLITRLHWNIYHIN